MKYDDISVVMRAFIGNREMMRRLGFAADDLYFQSARSARNSGVMTCFLVLRTGDKQFSIECGPLGADVSVLEAEYARVAQAINARELSEDDYFRIFQECEAYQATTGLIVALRARGFEIGIPDPSRERAWRIVDEVLGGKQLLS